jgi:hypothetical protein
MINLFDPNRVWTFPLPKFTQENFSMAKKKPAPGCPTRTAIDEILANIEIINTRLALCAKFEELRTAERMLHTLAQSINTLTERVEAIEATLAAEELDEDDAPVTRTWQQWLEGK